MNQSSAKQPFAPFENDHQSMQIGELIFENQMDKVIIYGDIDVTKSKEGLENALKLQKVMNDIVTQLQSAEEADTLLNTKQQAVENETQSGKEVDNPFS